MVWIVFYLIYDEQPSEYDQIASSQPVFVCYTLQIYYMISNYCLFCVRKVEWISKYLLAAPLHIQIDKQKGRNIFSGSNTPNNSIPTLRYRPNIRKHLQKYRELFIKTKMKKKHRASSHQHMSVYICCNYLHEKSLILSKYLNVQGVMCRKKSLTLRRKWNETFQMKISFEEINTCFDSEFIVICFPIAHSNWHKTVRALLMW